MQKTYLVEILSRLSSKQMRELGDFIKSPFFNKNESTEKLFEYLRNLHPEFRPEKIKKELVYSKLFFPAEYNDSFMRMIIFKLTELTEDFLAYSEMSKTLAAKELYVAQSLLDLGLDNSAKKTITHTEKKLNQIKLHDSRYYERKFELEKLKDIIYSRSYIATTVKDKPDKSLLAESDNLTYFYLIMVLQRYRYLLNKSFTVDTEFELDFLPYIMSFLEKEGKPYLQNKVLSLAYRQVKLLLDTSNEGLMYELKKELCNDATPIEKFDRRDGLTILANICIEKVYSGKKEFYKMMFEMNRYIVERNLYNRVQGGYFDKDVFTNIVIIALGQNEIKWVEEFIETNYTKLPPDIRENERNYCYCKICEKKGDYKAAKEYISKVAYTDVHMKVNARITRTTIEYELGNIEEVLNELENFRKYTQNDKLLSKSNRKICGNFIKFVNKLCKARYSFKVNLQALKEEITACEMVNHRRWLLEKTDELIQRKSI
ncbi:MAG: hypothetical protein IAE93_03860 [Ignavibacteria bacterium]|nr:hypothetical protein [Ignavibacteria bacterium]